MGKGGCLRASRATVTCPLTASPVRRLCSGSSRIPAVSQPPGSALHRVRGTAQFDLPRCDWFSYTNRVWPVDAVGRPGIAEGDGGRCSATAQRIPQEPEHVRPRLDRRPVALLAEGVRARTAGTGVDFQGPHLAPPLRVDAAVVHHVVHGVSDLQIGPQHECVVAVAKEGTLAIEGAIEALGDAHGQPLHAAGEGATVEGLHDEVDVIGLDGELDDGHAEAELGGGDGVEDDAPALAGAEAGHALLDAYG